MELLNICKTWLKEEGYRCLRLEDEMLTFKANGFKFVAMNPSDDPDFFKLCMYFNGAGIASSRQTMLEYANQSNCIRKVVKVMIDKDDDLEFSAEMLVDSGSDVRKILERLIDLLTMAALAFKSNFS